MAYVIDTPDNIYYTERVYNRIIHPKIYAIFQGSRLEDIEIKLIMNRKPYNNALTVNGVHLASGSNDVLAELAQALDEINESFFKDNILLSKQLKDFYRRAMNIEKVISRFNKSLLLIISQLESSDDLKGKCPICADF